MALWRQVVDLIRLHLLDNADEIGEICHVAIMQSEAAVGGMRVLIEVISVEERGAALDTVHLVTLLKQNSARYAPSWPVIPVIKAFFMFTLIRKWS
jgi:hypothetical protein